MKAVNDVVEFFNTFPKSEFNALSVIGAIHGSAGNSQIRKVLIDLVKSGYLEYRWKENRMGAQKMYRMKQSTNENACTLAVA